MLSGDMLLGPREWLGDTNAPSRAEAARMRSLLPKDIQIVDWRYNPGDNFHSPQLFRQAGFGPIIGATWYQPEDIADFSQSLAAQHQRGLLQTLWTEYHYDAAERTKKSPEFQAFILAADYAWSGQATPPDQLPYNPAQVYQKAY